jgi:hypothetical protein
MDFGHAFSVQSVVFPDAVNSNLPLKEAEKMVAFLEVPRM